MEYVAFSDEALKTFFITVYSSMGNVFNIALAVFICILSLFTAINIIVRLAQ